MSDNEKIEHTPDTICISLEEEVCLERRLVSDSIVPTMLSCEHSTQLSPPLTHEYPDGGLKANLTVFGAALALFCTFGQMNAFGTFQAWYATHQLEHMPASTISWIGSLQLWIFFFSGAPIGRLFDAYGPKGLMVAGTACYLASMIATSFSTRYFEYIIFQGILLGLGVGLIFYPSLASISTHFSKYRATALGIAVAGSGLGGVVYPVVLQGLFSRVGFGWGVRISGLVSGVGCVAATIMVSSLSLPKKPGPYFDIKTVADCKFLLLAAGSFFVALGLFIPFFYVVDYARSLSIPEHTSFYVLAVMNAGGVLGRLAPPYMSDTLGRFNLLVPCAFITGLSCVVFWVFAKTVVCVMLFAATYGFFSGAFISLVNPCVAQISDIRQIGTRIGMLYTIISVPSLIGGPAAGALLAHYHGSFTAMIAFAGTTVMLGSVLLLGAKLVVDRNLLAKV